MHQFVRPGSSGAGVTVWNKMQETAHANNNLALERSSVMNQNNAAMKVAALSEMDIESLNTFQSKFKTLNDKDVVLVAYEK